LLPEEAGVNFLFIGEISEGAAGLVLAQIADILLVLTPLRRVRAFARAFRGVSVQAVRTRLASGNRRSSRFIMMTNP
jgi:hypothetical protein